VVGERVKRARRRRAWTQEHLAREAGLTVRTLHRVEGEAVEPRPSTLHKLAGALGVRVEWLTEGEEPMAAGDQAKGGQ
jgi:transcriptional regulator with XRE-family HTH domain